VEANQEAQHFRGGAGLFLYFKKGDVSMKQTGLIIISRAFIFAILCLGLLSLPVGVWAIPSASFLYEEENISPGVWRYDYSLYNTSDPILDVGYNIFDVFLSFDPSRVGAILVTPDGWDGVSGSGFIEATSQNPGLPPAGNDIAPGGMLGTFSFLFDYRAGGLPFAVFFVNPSDPENSFSFNNTSLPATAPIPEPYTLLLLGNGLIMLGFLQRSLSRA
jgi:hypothetical protein